MKNKDDLDSNKTINGSQDIETFHKKHNVNLEKVRKHAQIGLKNLHKQIKEGEISEHESITARVPLTLNKFKAENKAGKITNVILHGFRDGFAIHCDIDVRPKDHGLRSTTAIYPTKGVLIKQTGTVRKIVNPESAVKTLMELDVNEYSCMIRNWNPTSFHSKHEASVRSRKIKETAASDALHKTLGLKGSKNKVDKETLTEFLKYISAVYKHTQKGRTQAQAIKDTPVNKKYNYFKKAHALYITLREEYKANKVVPQVLEVQRSEMLESRSLYIQKYIDHCLYKQYDRQTMVKDLTRKAIDLGLVDKTKQTIKTTTLFAWKEDLNAPAWACKSANELLLDDDIYPNIMSPIELAIFANLWFYTRGPFKTLKEAQKDYPTDSDFPIKILKPYMQEEINHYLVSGIKKKV